MMVRFKITECKRTLVILSKAPVIYNYYSQVFLVPLNLCISYYLHCFVLSHVITYYSSHASISAQLDCKVTVGRSLGQESTN